MIAPLFYVRPGDESFVPKVAHPHEDAGADIRAHVRNEYDRDMAIDFYRDFESDTLRHGTRLYIDGDVFTSESESESEYDSDDSISAGAGCYWPRATPF